MSVIQIREAQREGARLLFGLSGWTGSGKTRTALELAYGLANYNPKKIGFLDTENRRGSLYSDVFHKHQTHPTQVPFLIADLEPPFSPQRYIEAIKAFQHAGVEVLIIDSSSHEYEGTGGCIEIAEAGNPKLPNWNKAKAEHKKFMNALLASDMHIICCVRAREKSKPEKVDGKTVYIDLGLQEIQEKNFMFEMTVSAMMFDMGKRHEVRKCPGDLTHLFPGNGYLGSNVGKAIRDWVDGAKQLDPEVERARNTIRVAAQGGTESLRTAWGALTKDIRTKLGEPFLEAMKRSANDHDALLKEQAEGEKLASAGAPAAGPGGALAQHIAAGMKATGAAVAETGQQEGGSVVEQPTTAATDTPTAEAPKLIADTVEQTDANVREATDGRLGVTAAPVTEPATVPMNEPATVPATAHSQPPDKEFF